MKACISWHQKYIVPLYTYIYIYIQWNELFFSDEIKISEHIFASINMHQTSEFEQLIIWWIFVADSLMDIIFQLFQYCVR